MKMKSSTRSALAGHNLLEGGACHAVALREGGFVNLRMLLGLVLCSSGLALAIFAGKGVATTRISQPERYMPVPGADSRDEATRLAQLEQYWRDRLTYPTGRFNPAWVRAAAAQHARMQRGLPAGFHLQGNPAHPLPLTPDAFTALGPQPERM